jgi:very-short-patch-repair endonuclease
VNLPYNSKLKQLARELRNNSTLAEILLWRHLKGRQRKGHEFHRQKPIDEYIVDFFAHNLMLAVEIDGVSHRLKGERMKKGRQGDDRLVKSDVDAVVRAIDAWIEANQPKT